MENKKRILLVDDDNNIRTIYSEILINAGFLVEEAMDGADGLEKALNNIPDLVFTGIDMPRMDGFTFVESLKKNPATANIPIFMSSHRGRKEDEFKAREMGVKEFIVYVSITPKQVVEKIRALFQERAYLLKFSKEELDAQKLAGDFHIDSMNYRCQKCGSDLALSLEIMSTVNHEFKAKFVCPVCG